MGELNLKSISIPQEWEKAAEYGVSFPELDIKKMRAETKKNPAWVHFGAGNIFRGFISGIQNELLNKGLEKAGILAAEAYDHEIITKIYEPFDNLTLRTDLHSDGKITCAVTAGVAEAVWAHGNAELVRAFENPSLQLVSFTITEKGYSLCNIDGTLLENVKSDIANGTDGHIMSLVCSLLYKRYKSCKAPLALVSMDNCSHNGEKLKKAVAEIAVGWVKNGHADSEFLDYINDNSAIAFPWSMIDKITPRPSEKVLERLRHVDIKGLEPVVTSRGTYIAPFVNAEIPQYLVIEDDFPNGRPRLERAGVYMTDRETVNKAERMKVTTCLNPLHTALAVFGCLLGYKTIAEEMNDKYLKRLVEKIGYDEGMPVVTDPVIINPSEFLHEVLCERLPNPFIPDTPRRIATDTSQKIPVRFGETIKSYISDSRLDVTSLEYIPLAIAGWLRYLLGVDDSGNEMQLSPDPMLDELRAMMTGIEYNRPEGCGEKLACLLSNERLFGADLCACGLSEKITAMLTEMLQGKGSVYLTLQRHCTKPV